MMKRCESPNHPTFAGYGARGIRVCERWHTFDNFLADMGVRPDGKTLDRIDGSKGYSPDNCRWATAREQLANRSNAKLQLYEMEQVVWLVRAGYHQAEVAAFFGVSRSRVYKLQRAAKEQA